VSSASTNGGSRSSYPSQPPDRAAVDRLAHLRDARRAHGALGLVKGETRVVPFEPATRRRAWALRSATTSSYCTSSIRPFGSTRRQ